MKPKEKMPVYEVNKKLGYYYTFTDFFTSRGFLKNSLPDGTKMELIDSFTVLKIPDATKKMSDAIPMMIIQSIQIDRLTFPPYGLFVYDCTVEEFKFRGYCSDRKKLREGWENMCNDAIQVFSIVPTYAEIRKMKRRNKFKN